MNIAILKKEDYYKYNNEEEIKENCEIKINNKIIEFCYFYEFKEKGKYIIEYSFLKNIKKTDFMFCGCKSLTKLNLSNFNNMSYMLDECESLLKLNLSNFNPQNAINMCGIFQQCRSLTKKIYQI